eukprot:TRINITY_DN30824_c0_g1_i1.p1 TRINITY_DN30824_c0_g1~~TRINITY_DN30824_c0_g1_i1.p1  ORF type:complete len:717 (-),score=63.25 TRINITY_DN30824_c0_g1_i1:343-2493(-)
MASLPASATLQNSSLGEPRKTAPVVAGSLPFGRLVAVTRAVDTSDLIGVVACRQYVLVDANGERYRTKVWLLRLDAGEDGTFHWQDFRPLCRQCGEPMTRVALLEGANDECTLCNGRRGRGKCFLYECNVDAPGVDACGDTAITRSSCGNGPYFSGYDSRHRWMVDPGPPLMEIEEDLFTRTICSVSANQGGLFRPLQAFVALSGTSASWYHVDIRLEHSTHQLLRPVIEQTALPGEDLIASSLILGSISLPTSINKSTYVLCSRQSSWYVVRFSCIAPSQIEDQAELTSTPPGLSRQLVSLGTGKVIGLVSMALEETKEDSTAGLWALAVTGGWPNLAVTAAELAQRLSWRHVLRLPVVASSLQLCPRFLAEGPQENQVVVFASDERSNQEIRPRLLVHIPPPGAAAEGVCRVRHLASLEYFPLQPEFPHGGMFLDDPSDDEWDEPEQALLSIVRVSEGRSGYLFFSSCGQVYHMRDEAIIPAESAWRAFDSKLSARAQQPATFRFCEPDGQVQIRVCLIGQLTRYEYFEKLFERWQEGSSTQVEVTDVDAETFDALLGYVLSGHIGDCTELKRLSKILAAANKYMMTDLIAVVLLHACDILQCEEKMEKQEMLALAELLLLTEPGGLHRHAFRKKLLESILKFRLDCITDITFLRKAGDSVAELLEPIRRDHEQDGEWDGSKRRRKDANLPKLLWQNGAQETGAGVTWSTFNVH